MAQGQTADAASVAPEEGTVVTAQQSQRERAILGGFLLDCCVLTFMFIVSIAGGSFTLLAEAIRALPMNSLEFSSWVALRQIHRGRLRALEFGAGKLEQLVSLVVGCGMLLGAGWIVAGALAIVAGEQATGSPLGLTLAAVVNAVNLFINLIVWDSVRRAARGQRSIIMEAQLASRWVKLLSSCVVQVTMTAAALCLDPVIAAWADVAGSLFVAAVVFWTGLGLVRGSLPDLLDHTTDHWTHEAIDEVLAHHAGEIEVSGPVRSRRSGGHVFVEIKAVFPGGLTMAETDRRISLLRRELLDTLGDAEIAILVAAR